MSRLGLVVGFTASLAACVGFATAAPQQVRIYNWADLIGKQTIKDFQDKTGIQVQYDTFDSESTLQVKLLTGNSGYDVAAPSNTSLSQLIKAGALAELDRSKIPNWANQDPELLKFAESKDPGNRHSVIFNWGTTGIGMNRSMLETRMPDAPFDSLDLLFKPEIVSRFKSCGVALIDSPEDVYPLVLNYLGLDPQQPTEEALNKANALLKSILPNLRYIGSSSYISDLANGNICLVLGWSGDVETARARAEEAGLSDKIQYIAPREGALAWYGFLVIPKDAPNPEAAHRLINETLDPRVSANFTSDVGYATAVTASHALLPKEVVENPAIFPPEEVRKMMFWQADPSPRQLREMTRAWNRFKSSK